MSVQGPQQLPTDDLALKLLTDMTQASITGDIEGLQKVIEDWGALSTTKRAEMEELISQLIPPWILPMQMFTVFSNPDEYIGLSRLNPLDHNDASQMLSDVTTNAIVLSALTAWVQNQHEIAETSEDEASKAQATQASSTQASSTTTTTSPTSTNPIDGVLASYIANSGGENESVDGTQTMQFLRNNPILVSSLQTADPALLEQAYRLAESQIILGCLDRIIESQAQIHQASVELDRQREALGITPRQQLFDRLYNDVKDGNIPLTQTTFMMMQFLLVGSIGFQVGAVANTTGVENIAAAASPTATAPGVSTVQGVAAASSVQAATAAAPISAAEFLANLTAITSTEIGLTTARIAFPNDYVALSVLGSLPAIYERDQNQLTQPQQLTDLAQLVSAAMQMVPYWIIPAAISFQQAQGAAAPKTIPESVLRAFVEGIIRLVNDPAFSLMVQNAILRNALDPSKITPEQIKVYTAAVKIALLANALMVLYKVYMNKTAEERAALFGIPLDKAKDFRFRPQLLVDSILRGGTLSGTPLSESIIRLLKETLDSMKDSLPQENIESFITGLFQSFHPDTPVEELLDPTKQFLGLCEYINTTEQRG